jgi:hypothetical protein
MLNPDKKYNLEYYLGVVGAHILGVKDSSFTPIHRSISRANELFSGWRSQAKGCHSLDWRHQEEVP